MHHFGVVRSLLGPRRTTLIGMLALSFLCQVGNGPWLGVEVEAADGGLRVLEVDPDGPAAQRLKIGDVIVSAEGKLLTSIEELGAVLSKLPPHYDLTILTRRESLTIRLSTWSRAREVAFCHYRGSRLLRITAVGFNSSGERFSTGLRLRYPTSVAEVRRELQAQGTPSILRRSCEGQSYRKERVDETTKLQHLDLLAFTSYLGSRTDAGVVTPEQFLMD
jgi:hypothetical protein